MTIRIDGLSDLSEKLTHESARTAKRYLLNVARSAAEVVVRAMEETAPQETGRLEGEIDYQSKFSGTEQTTLTVKIGPARATFWGMFQEFGTRNQPGQHWMARAWAGCQNECLSVFGTEALARLADMEEKGK
jgi:HK97 gp10 family phage protein